MGVEVELEGVGGDERGGQVEVEGEGEGKLPQEGLEGGETEVANDRGGKTVLSFSFSTNFPLFADSSSCVMQYPSLPSLTLPSFYVHFRFWRTLPLAAASLTRTMNQQLVIWPGSLS